MRTRFPAWTVSVTGLEWRIRDTGGAGTPLVLLPGSLGNADIFFRIMLSPGRRRRGIAVDYPYAASDILVDGLFRLLDAGSIDRACLLGSSLAGYWLQHFGSVRPDRVAAMVLTNTFGDADALREHPLFRPDELDDLDGYEVKARWLRRLEARPADELRDVQIALLRDGQTGGQLRDRLLAAATAPSAPTMPSDRFPPGILDCADDPILPAESRDRLIARYPDAQGLRLESGGHTPHVTQWEAVERFVDQVTAMADR